MVNVIKISLDLNNQCGALPCEHAKNATLKGQSRNSDSQIKNVVGKPGNAKPVKKEESKNGTLNQNNVSGSSTQAQKEKKLGKRQEKMSQTGKKGRDATSTTQTLCIITTVCRKRHSMLTEVINAIAAEKQNPYFSPLTTLIMTEINTVRNSNLRAMAFTSGSSKMATRKGFKFYV